MRRPLVPRRCAETMLAVALLGLTIAGVPRPGAAATENPIVRGPAYGGLHGRPQFSSLYPVEAFGYVEQEFFISGKARQISGTVDVPYTTRIVVRRPTDPAKFNGTAVVEWVNVTGAADLETFWPSSGEWGMRNGFAWVSVSAQLVGTCCGPYSLKGWDPVRYAPIEHPGDDYSFDIYSQAMASVKYPGKNRTSIDTPHRVDPMGGLTVQHVIAHGASQSASRLTTYITAGYHAASRLADAFSITRGGGNAAVAQIAADTQTLVVQVNEESQGVRPDDTAFYIVYEEPGIAHAPLNWYQYVWRAQTRDLAGYSPLPDAAGAGCSMNRGTSQYTHRMSLYHTQRWLEFGVVPPSGPRLQRTGVALTRDQNGLALGGIRYPFIEAPVAFNSSEGCPLFGQYRPWSREKVLGLYPTQADYVSQVDAVADARVADGLLLSEDAAEAKAEARAFDVWGGGSCYDTANRTGNENGPVSSALHDLTYSTTTLGVPNALHEMSCNVFVPTGL